MPLFLRKKPHLVRNTPVLLTPSTIERVLLIDCSNQLLLKPAVCLGHIQANRVKIVCDGLTKIISPLPSVFHYRPCILVACDHPSWISHTPNSSTLSSSMFMVCWAPPPTASFYLPPSAACFIPRKTLPSRSKLPLFTFPCSSPLSCLACWFNQFDQMTFLAAVKKENPGWLNSNLILYSLSFL